MSALPGPEAETDVESWRRRALAAEAEVQDLHRHLAALTGVRPGSEGGVTFFEAVSDPTPAGPLGRGLADDGSDPKIVGLVMWSVAIVAGMVAVLSLVNNGLLSFFTWLMVLATGGLVWGAVRLRPTPTKVSVVKHMVITERGRQIQRFDLREHSTLLEVVGDPADPGWCVRFLRPGEPPITVDATAVDPREFMARLREFRPEL